MESIEQWWDRLDPVTRNWLVDNPGCVILPRDVVNAINRAIHGDVGEPLHGHLELSGEDQKFIRAMAGHGQAEEPGIDM